jgi:hypothetical protein
LNPGLSSASIVSLLLVASTEIFRFLLLFLVFGVVGVVEEERVEVVEVDPGDDPDDDDDPEVLFLSDDILGAE